MGRPALEHWRGEARAKMAARIIGIIGGSGLYDIEGMTDVTWRHVESSFGAPSDELCFGELSGVTVVFLPRHGRGHRIPPSEINYRANIDALKRMGVTDIVSISAVGSFREDLAPGTFVLVDQFIDRTVARAKSFFGTGLAAHVPFGRPVCARVADALAAAGAAEGGAMRRGGTYLCIEGPQFSTLAESNLYRGWGCDVIGMTNLPEANLVREAEICYATVAMVTDFDVWHPGHDDVTVEMVVGVVRDNAERAKSLIKAVVPRLAHQEANCPQGCRHVLDNAIITAREAWDPAMVAKLDAVAGRVLRAPT
jgi:5'-methylthioadenosine phosphorylase